MIDDSKVIDSFTGQHAFLSNFYLAEVEFEGRTYPTTEHAYQAAKIQHDGIGRSYIAEADTPKMAKKLGRSVPLRSHWDGYWKHAVMDLVLAEKFSYAKHPALADLLISTGDALLIEGNTWHDNTWGNCVCGHPLCARQGHNLLGVALMRRRAAPTAPVTL